MALMNRNPWLTIWTKPQETIRAIVTLNPNFRIIALAAIYGFPFLMHLAQNLSLGLQFPMWGIILGSAVLSPVVGIIGFTIISSLLYMTGRWIKGSATFAQVRAAVAWSNVPNSVNIILWLVLSAFFGNLLFLRDFAQGEFIGRDLTVVLSVFTAQVVLGIWSFIILLRSLGEVQKFSVWKSLLNIILPSVLVFILVWVVMWAIWAFSGMPQGV